jgi:hypothetical protein
MESPSKPQPRSRGRPRASVRSSTVSAYVPDALHDELIHRANTAQVSVSEYIKSLLVHRLRTPDRP